MGINPLKIQYTIMRAMATINSIISSIVKKLFGFVELFLFLRLLLKFLAANPQTLVVEIIYKYSDILIFPFKFIFPNLSWQGKVIETATISAMIGYCILVFIFFEILKFFFKD